MLLSVENLHVYYGAIHAVKDVSLHVQEGDIVTLDSGAKRRGQEHGSEHQSPGSLKPRSGKIQFMDHNVTGVAPNKIVQTGLVQCPEGRSRFCENDGRRESGNGAHTRVRTASLTKIWSMSTSCSRASKSAARRSAVRSPAASSRCWPWEERS